MKPVTETTTEAVASVSRSPLPDEELQGLRRLLLRGEGFALAFVRSNVPTESRRLVGELAVSLDDDDIEVRVLRLEEVIEDLQAEVAALEPRLATGQALAVVGFERSIPSGVAFPDALKRLNVQRERLRELPCPLVLILPDYALDLLARKAPDLWAWRSGVFETRALTRRLDERVLDGRLPTAAGLESLSVERKRAHLEILKTTLADLAVEGPGTQRDRVELNLRIAVLQNTIGEPQEALAHARAALDLTAGDLGPKASALGQIADLLEERGDLDEAMRIRQEEVLPTFEKLGDALERARTIRKITDIHEARGNLDEAMRIRQEEEIPVYEQLGDAHERAVTLGRIADLLEARGDFDEAMRIRREEELPVYRRLGDVRSQTMTLGGIADILEARGDLDEAMRIRREEELPVYERLGDVYLRAVTLGRIADILEARGDLDEAMRIRREEELPVYERLGNVYSRAVALGRIADILEARGDLDEALRIRREDEIPVYEKRGDVCGRAVTLGKIANLFEARGDLNKAMRILREEEIPVYERLHSIRNLLIAREHLALMHLDRNRSGDREAAVALLLKALDDAERLRLPEAARIRDILKAHELTPDQSSSADPA